MKVAILDNGFVELIDRMGNDFSILRSARVSTGSNSVKGEKKDRGLIRYLYKHQHMTPFEQVVFTFHMRSPLFVNQQLLRHRSFSFNQESARYKEFVWSPYFPDKWRKQDTKNKQGSLDELDFGDTHRELGNELVKAYKQAETFYEDAIEAGVAREQARTVMPMGQYTEIFFTVDLRNLLHFLELREHPHAQWEIQEYARAIHKILKEQEDLKWTLEIFEEMQEMNYAMSELLSIKKVEPDCITKVIKQLIDIKKAMNKEK